MRGKILVIGGTGLLGRPVCRKLKEDGFGVRVLTRNVEKARKRLPRSIEIVPGDPRDPETLRRAIDGCAGVHINLPNGDIPGLAEAVVAAAAKAGVERLSLITGATVAERGHNPPDIDAKVNAEKAVRESGMPHTIFRPSWFNESLPQFVRGGKAAVFGKQPHPFCWVAADDYARMVSVAFRRDEAEFRTFYVCGPEPIRIHEALRRFCAALHPEIKKVATVPIPIIKLVATITRNEHLAFAARMMDYFDKVPETGDPTEANRILGAPTTTLDQWLEQRSEG